MSFLRLFWRKTAEEVSKSTLRYLKLMLNPILGVVLLIETLRSVFWVQFCFPYRIQLYREPTRIWIERDCDGYNQRTQDKWECLKLSLYSSLFEDKKACLIAYIRDVYEENISHWDTVIQKRGVKDNQINYILPKESYRYLAGLQSRLPVLSSLLVDRCHQTEHHVINLSSISPEPQRNG